ERRRDMDVPPLDKGGLEGGLKEPRPARRSNTAVSSKKMWVWHPFGRNRVSTRRPCKRRWTAVGSSVHPSPSPTILCSGSCVPEPKDSTVQPVFQSNRACFEYGHKSGRPQWLVLRNTHLPYHSPPTLPNWDRP